MFDIAWSELALVGAVALIVIGPKDLPKVMRVMGQWTRKARLLAGEFQHNFDELVRQAELDEVRKQVQSVNPAAVKQKFQQEMETLIDPKAIEEALRVAPDQGRSAQAAASGAPTPGPDVIPPPPPEIAPTPAPDIIPTPAPEIVPPPVPDLVPPQGPPEIVPPPGSVPPREIPAGAGPSAAAPLPTTRETDKKPGEARL